MAGTLLLLTTAATAAPVEDSVGSLPLYGAPPTPQYSGFLDAGSGTYLHYWLALAQTVDDTSSIPGAGTAGTAATAAAPGAATAAEFPANSKPLILWLNGGPGSSSLLGWLQENGPLLINATGGLMPNPYSWTRLVNLLAIESPAGVGYSYCTLHGTPTTHCHNTDISTAADARRAVVSFFNKFPELRTNKFFITGESYAGVYVPTLAKEILDNAPSVNLRGVYVGDPCTDNAAQADSMDMLWYAHKYALVRDADFDLLWNKCKYRSPTARVAGEWSGASLASPPPRRRLQRRRAFDVPAAATTSAATPPAVGTTAGATVNTAYAFAATPAAAAAPPPDAECEQAERHFLATTSKAISQSWPLAYLNDLTLYGYSAVATFGAVGSLNFRTAQYMMRPDVVAALHLSASPASSWPGPPPEWAYSSSYAACNTLAPPGTPSMIDFYRELAPRLERTVVFNGDTDPCVSYEGTRTAIEAVGFAVARGGAYRPWFFNATAAAPATLAQKPILFGPELTLQPAGVQYGGSVVDYEHNLSFATVHGSGHMVPQFRPRASLQMISKLVGGLPLSPPLLSAEAMGNLSQAEFASYVNKWTVAAQSPPFVPAA